MTTNYSWVLICLVWIGAAMHRLGAQVDCPDLTFDGQVLHANRVRATVGNYGSVFSRNGIPGYTVDDSVSTIFATSFIMGAYDEAGELNVNFTTYETSTTIAPAIPPILTTTFAACGLYDYIWTVEQSVILLHLAELAEFGSPVIRRADLYGYPGFGNPHFEAFNGFPLPDWTIIAPFYDADADGRYNPDDGDYPLPEGLLPTALPATMNWCAFNNARRPFNQLTTLDLDVQQTVYAYAIGDPLIDRAVFTQHLVVNRSEQIYDSLVIGNWLDIDIGCYTDDLVGTAPAVNTVYGYNKDNIDGPCPSSLTSLEISPPVQALTTLNRRLDNSMYYQQGGLCEIFCCVVAPGQPAQVYNYLTGRWRDGTPLTRGGRGYMDGEEPAAYMFSDKPGVPDGWSALTINRPLCVDLPIITGHRVGTIVPGATARLDQVYSYHQSDQTTNITVIDTMCDRVALLQKLYDERFAPLALPETPPPPVPATALTVYPNPTTTAFTVRSSRGSIRAIEVYAVNGQLLQRRTPGSKVVTVATTDYPPGVYLLRVQTEDEWINRSVVVWPGE